MRQILDRMSYSIANLTTIGRVRLMNGLNRYGHNISFLFFIFFVFYNNLITHNIG